MKPWTQDVVEQLALAEVLNSAKISAGERLALIICDNAIEFMMIAHTEMEMHLVGKVIKQGDWQGVKESFKRLLDFTSSQEPRLAALKDEILSYHKIRNTLYHTGQPLAVKATLVARYISRGKELLEMLLAVRLSPNQWDSEVARVNGALIAETGRAVKAAVTVEFDGDAVRVNTPVRLGNVEAVCLVLDSFAKGAGNTPSYEQLSRSLSLSGYSHLSG